MGKFLKKYRYITSYNGIFFRVYSIGTYGVVEVVKNTTIPPSILADNQIENDTLVECNVALDGNITSQVFFNTYILKFMNSF